MLVLFSSKTLMFPPLGSLPSLLLVQVSSTWRHFGETWAQTYAFEAFTPLGPPQPESECGDGCRHTTYKGRYSDSDGERGVTRRVCGGGSICIICDDRDCHVGLAFME